MELRLYEYDKIIKNRKKVIEEYQKLNALEKFIKKMKGKKIEELNPVLFVVQYKDIGMPFQKIDEFDEWCNHSLYDASIEPIPNPNIDELWTIVQYEGDGLFTDLTTGKQFKLAHYEEFIKQKLNKDRIKTEKDYNDACSTFEDLMKIPLGISAESRHLGKDGNPIYFGPLHELTPELETKVVKETIPKKEEIKSALLVKEVFASKAIIRKYGSLYSSIVHENSPTSKEDTLNFGKHI